jgi:DNA polymerase-4
VEFAERIAHVDMDAFFVEVERLRRPELRGVAVVVGGISDRGVVASASYEARRRGVHSAMPTRRARRLCPHAVFLPSDHGAYREASLRVFAVLRSFTPVVESLSVDEAFLDVSGLRFHYEAPAAVGAAIRERLRTETGLPASVGLATSKLISKLASEHAKPDGMLVVAAGSETEFLHPLAVRALWGVGEATHARLEELGVVTVGDLAALPRATLERRLGAASGGLLWDLAHARDDRAVEPTGTAKSISVEHTYERDLRTGGDVEAEVLRHAHRLAARLRDAGVTARTVSLKVRYSDFSTVTRAETPDRGVDTAHDLFAVARRLLERVPGPRRGVRLIGLGATGLEPGGAPRQLELERRPWDDLEGAVDRIRERFGSGAVGPARLAGRRDPREPAPTDTSQNKEDQAGSAE